MEESQCSIGCSSKMIGNQICDESCDILACNFDGGDCGCTEICYLTYMHNGRCESWCDYASCDYDGGDCNRAGPSYLSFLTIIGFVIISLSCCVMIGIVFWYYRKRQASFVRITNSEESARRDIGEINNRMPEIECPEGELGENCAICLDR
jgi:hypothetical protein